jgi:cytochrome b subunit of formate dehydrogenase
MDKNKVKFLVDFAMGISFLLVALTGIFKWPRSPIDFSWVFDIINFRLMSRIHDWSGLILVILILVHLCLNWVWIKCMILGFFRKNECDVQKNDRKK